MEEDISEPEEDQVAEENSLPGPQTEENNREILVAAAR